MKSLNSDTARRARVRTVVAYPAVTVAFVVSLALALTPFGPSEVLASAASATPTPTSTITPGPTSSATTSSVPATTPATTRVPSLTLDPAAAFGDHHVLARIEGRTLQANYLPIDEPVADAQQFQTFRVRFRLHNAGTSPTTKTPQLEFRPELGTSGFAVVPEKPQLGVAFYVDREWVPSLGLGGGTMQGPLGENIAVADLRIGKEGGLGVIGHRSMGANPDRPVTLPSDSFTEQEFTVKLSIDAQYLTAYELRITDAGKPLTGTDVATIRLGVAPAVLLSPGQRQGVAVVDPKKTSSAGAAYPLMSAPVKLPSASAGTAVPAANAPNTLTYPLVAGTPSASTLATDATAGSDSIHGKYSLTTGKCAVCHSTHTAQAPQLLVKGSQAALCFTCHNTLGASTNVQADYPDPPVNINNSTTREYYSHDALAPSNHTRSGLDEFGGFSNRHSECADCHNSHKATSTATNGINPDSIQTPTGWTASGRLAGVSGVKVTNSTAGAAPTYTLLSGVTDSVNEDDPVTNPSPITLEYQLCFKCHSGFTTLTSNTGLKESKFALDKGVELNPNNLSFHPIEAPGKNDTAAMTTSLAGTSPSKLWDFTVGSTIRCLNCHANGSTDTTTAPPLTAPGAALAPHASSNRGILLKNYRDRLLKPSTVTSAADSAYSAADFALCYMCHAEAPFAPGGSSSNATNFKLHSEHLTGIEGKGDGGTDIDLPGAGEGKAICAECHFRIHSATYKANTKAADGSIFTQDVGGARLVSFAPNVQPVGTTLTWTPGVTGSGSCTLTCHGKPHNGYTYGP